MVVADLIRLGQECNNGIVSNNNNNDDDEKNTHGQLRFSDPNVHVSNDQYTSGVLKEKRYR